MSQGNSPVTGMDVLTSSGRYPEREQDPSCDAAVRANAEELAERVSKLLLEVDFHPARVSSGFRTATANAAAGGAKKSAHMAGQAVDIADPAGSLCHSILRYPHVLEMFDLYMENPQHSPGWVHLQTRRVKSGRRIFNP